MNNGFKLEDIVEFSDTGRYAIFSINGELYRIWFYTDDDVKYLQKIDTENDEIEEICEFH